MKRLLISLFILAAFAVSAAPYQWIITNSTTLYINPNGNDSVAQKGRPDLPWQHIEAAIPNGVVGDTFSLSQGTHVFTNPWVMLNGQSIIGQGPASTFVKWAGGQYSTNNNGKWTSIEMATNVYLAQFDIAMTNQQPGFFAACVGGSGGGKGMSNAVVESVSMHGDTDNAYWDSPNAFQAVRFAHCRFDTHWDALALNGPGASIPGNTIDLSDCVFNNIGPNVANITFPVSPAVCVRLGGTLTANIYADQCTFNSSQFIGSGSHMSFNNCRFNSTNLVWFENTGQQSPLVFSACNVTPDKIQQDANGPRISGPVLIENPLPSPNTNAAQFQFFGSTIELSNDFPLVSQGFRYYNTNTHSWRLFNGIHWQDLTSRLDTNRVVVYGTSDATYQGVYTIKSYIVDALPGFSYTNLNGKFFLESTNANADSQFGLSATESLVSGTEYLLSDQFNRGWDPERDVRVTYYENYIGNFIGDGSGLTNVTASTAPTVSPTNLISGQVYTNNSGKTEFVSCPVSVTTAAVVGAALVQLTVDTAGGINFGTFSESSIFGESTTVSTVVNVHYGTLAAYIPAGASYVITNMCSGTGNAVSLVGVKTLTQY